MDNWRRFVFIAFTKIFVSLVLIVIAGRGVLFTNSNMYSSMNQPRQVFGNMPTQSNNNLMNMPTNGMTNNMRYMYTAPMGNIPMQGNMYANNMQRSSGCGPHSKNQMWR